MCLTTGSRQTPGGQVTLEDCRVIIEQLEDALHFSSEAEKDAEIEHAIASTKELEKRLKSEGRP